MKLYYSAGSCSLSPHIALREAGLDFELIKVDTIKHTYSDNLDYYKVNELGYVPVLQLDNGNVLREGAVIIQYIADLAPKSGLAPLFGTIERYKLMEWLSFLSSEIHKGFIPLFYGNKSGVYLDIAKPKLISRFQWIDDQLAKSDYLTGNKFTIADCYLFALTSWASAEWIVSRFNLDIDLNHMKNIESWYKRMLKRPTVIKSIQVEGI